MVSKPNLWSCRLGRETLRRVDCGVPHYPETTRWRSIYGGLKSTLIKPFLGDVGLREVRLEPTGGNPCMRHCGPKPNLQYQVKSLIITNYMSRNCLMVVSYFIHEYWGHFEGINCMWRNILMVVHCVLEMIYIPYENTRSCFEGMLYSRILAFKTLWRIIHWHLTR